MYLYFVDKVAQQKGSQIELPLFESRLVELGITGRVEKMSMFKDARSLVELLAKEEGLHTIVAVGNDQTFSTVFQVAAEYPELTVGYASCDPDSRIAQVLGMPIGVDACQAISRRLTRTVDLGIVEERGQKYFFLGAVELPETAVIHCDEQFNVRCKPNTMLSIENAGRFEAMIAGENHADATDGSIEAVAAATHAKRSFFTRSITRERSVFFCDRLTVESSVAEAQALVDEIRILPLPITAYTADTRMKLIVGKDAKL